MSFDEKAYHLALKTWKRLQKKTYFERLYPKTVSLRPFHRSLLLLANSLSEKPVSLGFTDSWFGWNERSVFIPEKLRLTEDHAQLHRFVILQLCKAIIAQEWFGPIGLSTDSQRTDFAIQNRQALHLEALNRYDGYKILFSEMDLHFKNLHQLQMLEVLPVDTSFSPFFIVPVDSSMILPGASDSSFTERLPSSHGKAHLLKTKNKVELITLPQKKDQTNPITHNFEKLLTADDYKGGQKRIDGDDEILEHQEALEELQLSQVVRSTEPTQGLIKSDLMVNFNIADAAPPEAKEQCFFYDEWDGKNNIYKKNWCAVSEINPGRTLNSEVSSVAPTSLAKVRKLQREFNFIAQKRSLQKRVFSGDDIDLDAAVDYAISWMSHRQPDDRIEQSHPLRKKNLAILILQDLSLSTDSWVHNCRVLDLCKESIRVLGQVIEPFNPQLSIFGFCSHTHRDCRLIKIKSWDESWKIAENRLGNIHPQGYTRLGPALRHASFLLNKTSSQKKMILLLSDGKPNDYDQYEGRYGILDVRRAVLEAQGLGIRTECLAIDKSAKAHLPMMFQPGNYSVLSSPEHLVPALSRVFKRTLFT